MKAVFLLFIFCCWHVAGYTQSYTDLLEDMAEEMEDPEENDDMLLQLEYLQSNPLNLNRATAEDLGLFPFLTGYQIHQFLSYRKLLGPLLNVHELQAIPGWEVSTIERILPYIMVAATGTTSGELRKRLGRSGLLVTATWKRRLEESAGYANRKYTGSRDHYLLRLTGQDENRLYYGLVAEKDPGEPFFRGARKDGFDFYSFHLFARDVWKFSRVAIGDYRVNLGQGLIHWQSIGFRKSADVLAIRRQGEILAPSRSFSESGFSRGAALKMDHGRLETVLFFSRLRISANALDSPRIFTSMQQSGLHRSEAELADRKSVLQTTTGGSIRYSAGTFRISSNMVSYLFSHHWQHAGNPYQLYTFRGSKLTLAGIDYSWTYRNIHVFGEMASGREGAAFLNGILVSLDRKIDFAMVGRIISPAFQSPFGNAFTESTRPGNESGLYFGLQIRPSGNWNWSAYYDFFRFPWLRYRVDAPAHGNEMLIQGRYQPHRQTVLLLRFRSEEKPANQATETMRMISPVRRTWLRFQLNHSIARLTNLAFRAENLWLHINNLPEEAGFLSYFDLNHRDGSFRVNARIQYFETDSYDSRIFTFEQGLIRGFAFPSFFDRGYRYIINLQFQTRHCKLGAQYARTRYLNRLFSGSGNERIMGSHISDIGVQVQIHIP